MAKLVPLTVTLPEDVFHQIHDHARSQYLSRSAVVRRLIIEELERRKAALPNTEGEVTA
jgi:metal-responsive CopG/Arc/MetJ family transcriptional regulator